MELALPTRKRVMPSVMENANQDAMAAETGVGLSADVAVIQRLNDGLHITVPGQVEISELDAVEMIEDITDGDQPEDVASDSDLSDHDQSVEEANVVEIVSPPLAEQVQKILDAQAKGMAGRPMAVASADVLPDSGSNKTYFLNWLPYAWQMTWADGGLQEPLISVDFKIELYAVNNPFNKFLVISPVGGGISPGELRYNEETGRGYYLESAVVEYGPQIFPQGLSVLDTSPDNNNNSGSFSISKGFEVSGSIDKDGPGLSGSYNSSETTTVEFTDFTVENKINGVRGRWEYKLATVEGQPYADSRDLVDDGRCLTLPPIARNGFQPQNHVVWKAPGDFNGRVKIDFYVEQVVRLVGLRIWKNKFGMTTRWESHNNGKRLSRTKNNFTIDFSQVQAPVLVQPSSREELAQQLEAMERRLGSVERQIRQLTRNQQPLIKRSHVHSREIKPMPANIPSAGNDRGLIVLLHRSARRDLWAVVQWQNNQGNWEDTVWKGSLNIADGVSSRSEALTNERQFGTGPFRWQIFDKQGGRLLTGSDAFYLPAAKGETVFVEV